MLPKMTVLLLFFLTLKTIKLSKIKDGIEPGILKPNFNIVGKRKSCIKFPSLGSLNRTLINKISISLPHTQCLQL